MTGEAHSPCPSPVATGDVGRAATGLDKYRTVESPAWRATSHGAVRVLAWTWTRVFSERLRVATMWWLNEKVAVRVVAVVPGPHGSVLAWANQRRLVLPSVRLGRDADPEAAVGSLVREGCGFVPQAWVPIDAVRRPGARLDAIFVAKAARANGVGGRGRVAWVAPSMITEEAIARWLEAGSP